MRILLAGDTHGSLHHAEFLINMAVNQDCAVIIQLGDWGFTWPGRNFDSYKTLEEMLSERALAMFWIDGNHENFTDLQQRGFWGADHFCAFKDALSILYIPRGLTWEWQGCTFMAMGGAWSIDQDQRTPGASWWPEETISMADIERAEKTMRKVDVFLSHDAPEGVAKLENRLQLTEKEWGLSRRHCAGSMGNRQALFEVVKQAKPEILYHGHYHFPYTDMMTWDDHTMRVIGLAHDGAQQYSWAVVDTDTFHHYQ